MNRSARVEWVARLPAPEIPAPLVLPSDWRETETPMRDGLAYRSRDGLVVAISADVMSDNSTWMHVSLSRAKHVPTYADLCRVKDVFVGAEREAIQKFPKRSEHYNFHEFCLHLWCRLDADATPDFRILFPDGSRHI